MPHNIVKSWKDIPGASQNGYVCTEIEQPPKVTNQSLGQPLIEGGVDSDRVREIYCNLPESAPAM